jgi:hypothetical protein
VVGDDLQDVPARPLHRLGGDVLLAALRQEQRVAPLVLHRGWKRLQHTKRVDETYDGMERLRMDEASMPYLA